MKNELKKFKNKIDKLKEIIKELNNILNNVSDIFQNFYKIFYDIVYNYDLRRRNYQILKNVNSVKDFITLNDIDKILLEKDFKHKFEKIYDIYYQMNVADKIVLIFEYQGNRITIQATKDMTFEEVCLKFFDLVNLPNDGKYKIYYNSMEIPKHFLSRTLFELQLTNLCTLIFINEDLSLRGG